MEIPLASTPSFLVLKSEVSEDSMRLNSKKKSRLLLHFYRAFYNSLALCILFFSNKSGTSFSLFSFIFSLGHIYRCRFILDKSTQCISAMSMLFRYHIIRTGLSNVSIINNIAIELVTF
jgi:hypothetical protein